MAGPLLRLQTLTECPSVEIDRKLYQLTPPEALDLVSVVKLETFQATYGTLAQRLTAGERSDDDLLEAERAVDELVRIVLRAPAAVIDRLSGMQRLNVVSVFFELSPNGARATAPTPGRSRPTGANSPRNSRGSTAVARSSGSPAPRPPLSRRASR